MSDDGEGCVFTLDMRLSDGRLLRNLTICEIGLMADGATPAMAGTIYRKVGLMGCRLERRTAGSWAVISGSDGLPLLTGSPAQIEGWLRVVKAE